MSGLRAVVLAAGMGIRLRPLTEFEPKPLLPVGGAPLVSHTLAQLEAAGCEAAALNLYHLGDQIRETLGSAHGKMPLVYSEERELLGTMGALAPLREFWRDAEVLIVVNGDSLCRWPIRQLVKRHRRRGAEATLLLSKRARTEVYGGVGIDIEGRLVSVRPGGTAFGEVERRRVFAGAQALSPALLDGMPDGPQDFVSHLWVPMMARGRTVRTYESGAAWFESGTPELYLRSVRGWVGNRWLPRWLRGSWIAPGATVDPSAKVTKSVIEAGAVVEEGSRVDRSLLLPGARASRGSQVEGSVLGFGAKLAPATRVTRRLVTPERAEIVTRTVDSIVGGLVFSPLTPAAGARERQKDSPPDAAPTG